MCLELLLDLGRPIQKACSRTMDFSFDVELAAFNGEGSTISLCQNESLRGHVLFNFLYSNVNVGNIVSITELVQILCLAGQTSLHLEHVEESLSTDLTSVGSEKDVLASFLLHLVGEHDGALDIEVLEESLRELREAVRVGSLLPEDDG